jgi:hypothetical protein
MIAFFVLVAAFQAESSGGPSVAFRHGPLRV